MDIKLADRLKRLPPYLFAELDRKKREIQKRGVDIIDLGVGDPDLPTPAHIVRKLKQAASEPSNHHYPSYEGFLSLREAVARWYKKRFKVKLNPEKEIMCLIGSKEGIAHLPLAFLNPGDVALVPNPAYPVYSASTVIAGGNPFFMPLYKENGFLPDLKKIPKTILKKAKIMFLNYPNNPTSAVAEKAFFEEVIKFARQNNIIVCHDASYTEISFDGFSPPSILQAKGAKEVAVEFHSLSKTYNMTGWRIGFVVGNKDVISGLGKIKTNIDSGVFQAIQIAAIEALEGPQDCVIKNQMIYKQRRDLLVEGFKKLGMEITKPKATFYLWIPIPKGYSSSQYALHLLTKAGIVTTPGNGFGEFGEGYIRVALTVDKKRIKETIKRIEKIS